MTRTKRFQLDRDDAVLLVVDIQERLAAVMAEREKVVANAARGYDPVFRTSRFARGGRPD